MAEPLLATEPPPADDPRHAGEDGARRVRAMFLSDLHLGTRGCQAELLLDFLRWHDADVVYLVGDAVDGWRLKKAWYWPQSHNDVVQKLLRKVRKGARLVYVPGNHDEFLRDYAPLNFGGVEVVEECVHVAADGRRYAVLHGDKFDAVIRHAKWLAHLGDWAYEAALAVSALINVVRRRLGVPYWSLSAWAKLKVKNAVNFIGDYEAALVAEARKHGADGVICGHIHHAALREAAGVAPGERPVTYVNTGDWVESCTAVLEDYDGRLELVRWTVPGGEAAAPPAAPAALPATLPAPANA